MRIFMVGQKGIPAQYGGIERHVEELAVELTQRGHHVTVYARAWYTPKTTTEWRGIKIIHTIGIHTKNLDAISHTLTATLHALFQKPDIIHYHGVGPALLAWIPRIFLPRTKVIATFHCLDRYHQKWNWFARRMLRLGEWAACTFPHQTIAVSHSIKNYCLNEYQRETIYIPNGTRPITDSQPALLSTLKLKPKKYIALVARLVPHKGVHYLISAWQQLKRSHPTLIKNYKLAIIGDSAFTDTYVQTLKKQAANDADIVFTGWQQGQMLNTLFQETALLVHPSENEGLPLTVLNGMAAGVPVLVSDITEHKELIDDKNFIFITADSVDLAKKMINILQHPQQGKTNAKIQQQKTREIYAWDNIARQTEKIYRASSLVVPMTPSNITTKIA